MISCEISLFVMAANREGILVTTYVSLVSLSMGFQKFSLIVVGALVTLLISKPTLCKMILSSSFVLESRMKTDKLFFYSLEAFTSKIQGKTVNTILVDQDFCQIV